MRTLRHGRQIAGALLSAFLLSVALLPATPASAADFNAPQPAEFAAQVNQTFEIAGRDDTPGAVDSWSVTVTSADLAPCFRGVAGGVDYLAVRHRVGGGALGGLVDALGVYDGRQELDIFSVGQLRQCLAAAGKQLPTDRFHLIGGQVQFTNPAAVRAPSGDYDLYSNDGPGTGAPFVRQYQSGQGWRNPALIGGEPQSGPDPLRMPDGSANIYYVARDLALAVGHLGLDRQYTSQGIGGQIRGRPAAVLLPDRTVAAFVQGVNHRLYEAKWWFDGTFIGWVNLGGPAQAAWSGPAAASTGGGRMTVVINTAPNGLASRSYDPATGWGPWQTLTGNGTGDLGAASPAPGVFDLYVRGFSRTPVRPLYTRRAVTGVWAPWVNLGGDVSDLGNGGPFAAAHGSRTDVWLTGTNGRTYQRIRTSSGWSSWIAVAADRP